MIRRQSPLLLGRESTAPAPTTDGGVRWAAYPIDRRRSLDTGARLLGFFPGSVTFATPLDFGLRIGFQPDLVPGQAGRTIVDNSFGLRAGFYWSIGRVVTHSTELGLESTQVIGSQVSHLTSLQLLSTHDAMNGRAAIHLAALQLEVTQVVVRGAEHQTNIRLMMTQHIGRAIAHDAVLSLEADHVMLGGRLASHSTELRLLSTHTTIARAEHSTALKLDSIHHVGRSATQSTQIRLSTSHVVGRSAIHLASLRLLSTQSTSTGDAGELLAMARSLGSAISIDDAAILMALTDQDLGVALALVPDL